MSANGSRAALALALAAAAIACSRESSEGPGAERRRERWERWSPTHPVVEQPYRVWLRGDLRSSLGRHRYELDASRGALTAEIRFESGLELEFVEPEKASGVRQTIWSLSLDVGGSEALAVGRYEVPPGGRKGAFPQLVSNQLSSNECSQGGGWFEIVELERGTKPRSVARLALDFESRCRSDGTGVTLGQVRIDSEVPIDREWIAAAIWLSRGPIPADGAIAARRLAAPEVSITRSETRPERVSFTIGEGGAPPWTLSFATARGEPLELGRYLRAAPPAAAARDRPRLGVGLADGECGAPEGWFEILELEWESEGVLERFAATFDRRCEDPLRGTRGQINWNASAKLANRLAARDPGTDGY